MRDAKARRLAVIAGHGDMPRHLVEAAGRSGWMPVVFAIAGEADAARFTDVQAHTIGWGEIGRLFRLIHEAGCREAVFIGGIRKRPRLGTFRLDVGALKLLPRLAGLLLTAGDDRLLRAVSAVLEGRGVTLLSPIEIAPGLAPSAGVLAGEVPQRAMQDIEAARAAARTLGSRDIGQAAVAVGGVAVALEDAHGTEALLTRVAAARREGRIAGTGGALVKCMKPQQDSRLDLPTVGPATAEQAAAAGLDGVAVEAGQSLLAGRSETIEAFRSRGLFLFGMPPARSGSDG